MLEVLKVLPLGVINQGRYDTIIIRGQLLLHQLECFLLIELQENFDDRR